VDLDRLRNDSPVFEPHSVFSTQFGDGARVEHQCEHDDLAQVRRGH
jgi:hypothetical protein